MRSRQNASVGEIERPSATGNASAGNVGEYVSTTVLVGSAVSMTTATPVTIATISLTSGDWDVSIQAAFTGTATGVTRRLVIFILTLLIQVKRTVAQKNL
jgi:hypothetical protein